MRIKLRLIKKFDSPTFDCLFWRNFYFDESAKTHLVFIYFVIVSLREQMNGRLRVLYTVTLVCCEVSML